MRLKAQVPRHLGIGGIPGEYLLGVCLDWPTQREPLGLNFVGKWHGVVPSSEVARDPAIGSDHDGRDGWPVHAAIGR
jgi:hypothetical protein